MRTANPVLNEKMFERYAALGETSTVMTVEGTIWKSLGLLGILIAAAAFTWMRFFKSGGDFAAVQGFLIAGLIGGVVFFLITCFKAQWAPWTSPIYAACEGFFLGGLSAFVETRYEGIVFQAVMLTFSIFAAVLLLYTSRTIRATEKFKVGVLAATGGIAIVYLVSMLIRMFGGQGIFFIHEGGALGIGFSVFVIVLAALNFILDFDLIENGAKSGAPKFMEWFAAFGLLVTLVWLYIEVLRLLAKLRSK